MPETISMWEVLLVFFVVFIFYSAWKIIRNADIFDDDRSPTWTEIESRRLNKPKSTRDNEKKQD